MRIVKVKDIPVGGVLRHALFHRNGMLLLAAGSRFTMQHKQVLDRSEITTVVEYRTGAEPERPEIRTRPVNVTKIRTDALLKQPLYNASGVLLFSSGTRFTRECLELLLQAGYDTVYEVEGEETAPRAETLVSAAQVVGRLIDERLDREGHAFVSDAPSGPAFLDSIVPAPFAARSAQRIHTLRTMHAECVEVAETLYAKASRGQTVPKSIVEELARRFLSGTAEDQPLLLSMLSLKNDRGYYVFRHSINVALICVSVAATMGYSQEQISELAQAALLHDLGMMLVPKYLLDQDRPLNRRELGLVSNHVYYTMSLLDHVQGVSERVKVIVYQGHERANGSGYPAGRPDALINGYSKILALADTYEALTCDRPHRKALLPYQAAEKLVKMSASGLFNPAVARAFLETFSLFPVGSYVRLFDGQVAQVVGVNRGAVTKPVVRVVLDAEGRPAAQGKAVNLMEQRPDAGQPVTAVLDPQELNLGVFDGM